MKPFSQAAGINLLARRATGAATGSVRRSSLTAFKVRGLWRSHMMHKGVGRGLWHLQWVSRDAGQSKMAKGGLHCADGWAVGGMSVLVLLAGEAQRITSVCFLPMKLTMTFKCWSHANFSEWEQMRSDCPVVWLTVEGNYTHRKGFAQWLRAH